VIDLDGLFQAEAFTEAHEALDVGSDGLGIEEDRSFPEVLDLQSGLNSAAVKSLLQALANAQLQLVIVVEPAEVDLEVAVVERLDLDGDGPVLALSC
jgi:hypothetical protein